MMTNMPEAHQICQHFMKELILLTEQTNKNQFLAALLTAVLTYHLAWVPTVMPSDHPPIKSFSEKHASQSVSTLAKSHPYNPLWAQLGDLYGAIGSPVRLTRTVVVGKRQELVQRILYILTYFIRCSELQENHLFPSMKIKKDEDVQGSTSVITSALEEGELEELEYVVVTKRNEPSVPSPLAHQSAAKFETTKHEPKHTPNAEDCLENPILGSKRNISDTVGDFRALTSTVREAKTETVIGVTATATNDFERQTRPVDTMVDANKHAVGVEEQIKPYSPEKTAYCSSALPCPQSSSQESATSERVTFKIGSSASTESEFESCQMEMNKTLKAFGEVSEIPSKSMCSKNATSKCAQTKTVGFKVLDKLTAKPNVSYTRIPSCEGGASIFDEYFVDGNNIETNTMDVTVATEVPEKDLEASGKDTSIKGSANLDMSWLRSEGVSSAMLNCEQTVNVDVPSGGIGGIVVVADVDIPSSDSALGESEDEGSTCNPFVKTPSASRERHEELAVEQECPLPSYFQDLPGAGLPFYRWDISSSQSMNHFGRSLFGGYCTAYMPDFVLHGTSNDDKLKQCLMADLHHAMHHPVLDEPVAETVCIIADTDKWNVQVATSQRKMMDSLKLGQDVLVSSQVSSLLQSILQLYKLNLSPTFCVMHLEDRLQEFYFKSKMLSEYLRGHTRVHVKELGVVLGIESNDLPLLAAVASTHSPYVAQILL